MMEAIRHWAFGACGAAIACGIMRMVLPASGLQRMFNVTASVFFLCCLLSPAFLSPLELEGLDWRRQELGAEIQRREADLSAALEENRRDLAAGSLRLEGGRVLEGLGVEGGKIYVNVHDTPEGGISISECEVQLPERYAPRHDEIRGALTQRLGVRVILGYEVENKE